MQADAEIIPAKKSYDARIIKKFGLIINSNKMAIANAQFIDLVQSIKELAEYKNYAEAQYYLARYFFMMNDIYNYKFWLMRAAKNNNPHPLANVNLIKFCLHKHQELNKARQQSAERYLQLAKERLYFLLQFTYETIFHRVDWLYAKEQAQLLWQRQFANDYKAVEVWSAPGKNVQATSENCNARRADFISRAGAISRQIKNLLGKYD